MHCLFMLIIYLGGIILIFQKLKEVKELVQLLSSRGDSKPALFPSKAIPSSLFYRASSFLPGKDYFLLAPWWPNCVFMIPT